MNNQNVIEAENLTKKFDDFTAVNNITFEVKKGEIFGFLGANGAGKTTAMKMLIGISSPSSGNAKVAGFDVYKNAEDIKKNIGYMSQKFALYDDLTVKENITFYGGIYGLSRKRIKEKRCQLVEDLGLHEVVNELVSSLPLGWKQKLAFSVALLHNPKIIFLDEPTGGVDPITRRQFWEMIYKTANKGTTVFVTTHYMDEAEYCDRVSIMVNGKIEAINTPKKLKEQFKVDSMNDVFLKLARG
jgi:ABC-2 type transport system ATP-binding protein